MKMNETDTKKSRFQSLLDALANTRFIKWVQGLWESFKESHPQIAQFFVFFMLSNGVTVLQMVLMPLLRRVFNNTNLVHVNFQVWRIRETYEGDVYYVFDFAEGYISEGGGGGLAYFLAVQIALAIAQIINFFAQRNITFKSNTNPWIAALWYLIAYVIITITAAALHGWYSPIIYAFFMETLNLGGLGETIADTLTMIIYAAISFWVFFPIFKIIFKRKEEPAT